MKISALFLGVILSAMTVLAECQTEQDISATEQRIQFCYNKFTENYLTLHDHSGFPDKDALDANYIRNFLDCQTQREGVLNKKYPQMSNEEMSRILLRKMPKGLDQAAEGFDSIFE